MFVVRQEYGRHYDRDTRRHRDTQLHRAAGQGEGRRRHGATAYRGDVAATLLRRQNAYAGNTTDLEAYGFRQGEQVVTVGAADAST